MFVLHEVTHLFGAGAVLCGEEGERGPGQGCAGLVATAEAVQASLRQLVPSGPVAGELQLWGRVLAGAGCCVVWRKGRGSCPALPMAAGSARQW